MKNGLEVKNILFGELRQISAEEFRDSTGLDWTWDGLMDGIDVRLVLANSSEETKKTFLYTVSRADIPTATQWSWGSEIEVKPDEEKEISYAVTMPGIPSSDYRDYTGPLRYAVEVTVSDPTQGKALERKLKYYLDFVKVIVEIVCKIRYNKA